MHLIVMGVAGCGKSTIGLALAEALGRPFLDADDFHPEANRKKMQGGIPLSDEDRAPWLASLHDQLTRSDESIVLACSALRSSYRQKLSAELEVIFVYLKVSQHTAAQRAGHRDHFFPESLVTDQFLKLEEPLESEALLIDADAGMQEVLASTLDQLSL